MRKPPCSTCGRPSSAAYVLPDAINPTRVEFACQSRHVPRDGHGFNGHGLMLGDWRADVVRLRQTGREAAADLLAAAIRREGEAP